jgi:hypothetical protein
MKTTSPEFRPRVLVVATTPLWQSLHAIMLEVALRWWASGMDVTVISCDGALESCPANPFHRSDLCHKCVLQTERTETRLLPNGIETRRLHLLDIEYDFGQPKGRLELLQIEHRDVPIGRFVASQLATNSRDGEFVLDHETSKEARRLLAFAARLYDSAEELFRKQSFDIVCVRNGRRPSEGPIAWAAHRAGAWTLTFDDQLTLGRFILTDGLSVHDRVAAGFERRRRALEILIEPGGFGRLMGASRDFYAGQRASRRRRKELIHFASSFDDTAEIPKTEKPLMLVAPSSQWEFIHVQEVHENQYETLLDLLTRDEVLSTYDVVVRWHPNLKSAGKHESTRIRELIECTSDRVFHLPPESTANTYKVLDAADAVVTFGSTLSAEAAVLEKPTFVFGSAASRFGPSVNAIASVDELVASLNEGSPSLGSPFAAHLLGATTTDGGLRAVFAQPVKANRWLVRHSPWHTWQWIDSPQAPGRTQHALRQALRLAPRWVFRLAGK